MQIYHQKLYADEDKHEELKLKDRVMKKNAADMTEATETMSQISQHMEKQKLKKRP